MDAPGVSGDGGESRLPSASSRSAVTAVAIFSGGVLTTSTFLQVEWDRGRPVVPDPEREGGSCCHSSPHLLCTRSASRLANTEAPRRLYLGPHSSTIAGATVHRSQPNVNADMSLRGAHRGTNDTSAERSSTDDRAQVDTLRPRWRGPQGGALWAASRGCSTRDELTQ